MIMNEEESVMNKITTFALLAVALLAMAASVPALAGGGHRGGYHGGYYGYPRVSVGFAFGGPAYWGYPGWGYAGWGYPGYNYPPPYYYYPRAGGVPAEPTVYIERGDAYSPPEQSQGYWYYCPEAKAYHPYVKQCAGGWQRVSPTPPGG
jgi:hypothetical protein